MRLERAEQLTRSALTLAAAEIFDRCGGERTAWTSSAIHRRLTANHRQVRSADAEMGVLPPAGSALAAS
jgi:hypothetical protein